MRMRLIVAVAGLVASLGVAGGQDAAKDVISNGGLMHTLEASPVLNEPYSAVQEQTMVQTLSDGSKVNKGRSRHAVLRDSAGRVRVEQVVACACKNTTTKMIQVYVLDPVAHTLTTWGAEGEKVAMVFKLPAESLEKRKVPEALSKGSDSRTTRPDPIITTENLGTVLLNEVPVEDVKTTTIVPPGRSGNESAITKTHEVWTSDEMKLVLKEQWNDPRTGLRTVELKDFKRGEPKEALFKTPSDYKVKDLKQTLAELQQRLAQVQASM